MTGICSACRLAPARAGQRYCRACHAAHMRRTRPVYGALPEEAQRKARCRAYSKTLVRRGILVKAPCEGCGRPAQMHHPDYDNPRLVQWLCGACHQVVHALAAALVARLADVARGTIQD